MPETFIELVPKSAASLQQEMAELQASGLPFDGYNIPELRRSKKQFLCPKDIMQMRSDGEIAEGKQLALHLRTRERSVQQTIDRLRLASRSGVNLALLITGDRVEAGDGGCTSTHDVLPTVENMPLRIGIGADLYEPNWGRWERKIPAIQRGIVDAVFTQPIFDPSTLGDIDEKTRTLFTREQIYAGITLVQTERSRRYWHEKNRVPASLLPQGNSDSEIARHSLKQATNVLRTAIQEGYSTYIMLMGSTISELEDLFSLAENIQEL